MNDNQIQQILRTIKTLLKCPNCGAHYEQSDVRIVADSENQALVELNCFECGVTAMADFMVSHNVQKKGLVQKNSPQLRAKSRKPISIDDLLEMHHFLKDFNGDFEKAILGK